MDIRQRIRGLRLRFRFTAIKLTTDSQFQNFVCNICGKQASAPIDALVNREAPSCYHCYSSKRFRSLMAALSEQLHGEIIPLTKFPKQKHITGIGMSDSKVYATPLGRIFSYTNTFYHKKPRLDITSIGPELNESIDFVISSDVFEHVPPPVGQAFANLHRLLKPGGICILSVPYTDSGETLEHFPELYDFKLVRDKGTMRLLNKTRDGANQVFENLSFHGGGGATLEMRLFSKPSLMELLANANFTDIKFYDMDIPKHGILLGGDSASLTISMRKS